MKSPLEKFNTAETWIDVDILAKLKGVSKRAIRLSFNSNFARPFGCLIENGLLVCMQKYSELYYYVNFY